MSDLERLKATIYIGGLDNLVTIQTLHAAFIPFGDIVDITLPKPNLLSSTDPHKGFGYIEFENGDDAKEAIDNMDQSELFGKVIRVAKSKPQKNADEGLGSKTAVWEQEAWVAKNSGDQEDEDQKLPVLDPMQGLEDLDVAGPKQ